MLQPQFGFKYLIEAAGACDTGSLDPVDGVTHAVDNLETTIEGTGRLIGGLLDDLSDGLVTSLHNELLQEATDNAARPKGSLEPQQLNREEILKFFFHI